LPPDCEAGIPYCRRIQDSEFNELLDPEFTFYSDVVWFTSPVYVNSQSKKLTTGAQKINPDAVHEVPLHVCEVVVWWKIIGRSVTQSLLQ
jgi:hypothetical protein